MSELHLTVGDLIKFNDTNFDEIDYIKAFQEKLIAGNYSEAYDFIKSKGVDICKSSIFNELQERLYNLQKYNEMVREPITFYGGDQPTNITKKVLWIHKN